MNDSDIRARAHTSHRPRRARRARRVGASLVVVAVGAGAFFALLGGDSAAALSDTADGDAVVSTTYCEPGALASWEVHGTIKNTSGRRHRFRVDARYFRGGKLRDGHGGTTRPLAAGRCRLRRGEIGRMMGPWQSNGATGSLAIRRCEAANSRSAGCASP